MHAATRSLPPHGKLHAGTLADVARIEQPTRLFLDSNVLTGGIVSPWGLDKAALSLCAARLCRLVLAEVVRDEVEENLLLHAERLSALDADEIIDRYRRLIKLTAPEIVPYPAAGLVESSRHLIRHAADVPVLLSAMASKPDWLLTHNTKHFRRRSQTAPEFG